VQLFIFSIREMKIESLPNSSKPENKDGAELAQFSVNSAASDF